MKALAAWALGLAALGASAAGLTDEAAALAVRQFGGAHLVPSDDGQWRLRAQGGRLLRERVTGNEPAQQVAVVDAVHVLATSATGQRAVVQTAGRCVLVVDFAVGPAPRLHWPPKALLSADGRPRRHAPAERRVARASGGRAH